MDPTRTNRAIVWAALILAVLANIAGYAFDLYDRLWWFDEVVHAYTIFAITLALGLLLYGRALTGARDRRLLLILVIAATGLAIGALWEVAEWAYDQLVAGDVIKDKRDTIIDLIMDSIGALVAGALAAGMVDE